MGFRSVAMGNASCTSPFDEDDLGFFEPCTKKQDTDD